MKIRIDDGYSDLEGDYNIVVNEYSQNDEELQYEKSIYEETKYEERKHEGLKYADNTNYNMENNSMFNVEVQYTEDKKYEDDFVEKHREYDEYYKNQEINFDNTDIIDNKESYYNEQPEIESNYFEPASNEISGKSDFESLANESCESYINDYKEPYYKKFSDECDNYCKNDFEPEYENVCNDNFINNIKERKGEIKVYVRLENKNGVEIKGAKVNLYSLNGVCPKLHESKLTDCKGEVLFSCLENGCYRVISIVDRRYFEKPIYTTWNEVIIDNCVKEANIGVVNKIKPSCYKR